MGNLENRIGENSQMAQARILTYGLDLCQIGYITNPNVRKVAMLAKEVKDKMDKGEYEIHSGYSEAYSGESA